MKATFACVWLIPVLTAACTVGMEVHEFKPARGPQGVHMQLVLDDDLVDDDEIEGELLAVRHDGLVLNVRNAPGSTGPSRRLVLVPFAIVKTVRPEQMGRHRIDSRDREKNAESLDRLRLVARFPQGLSDDLLSTLLAESGQAQLELPERRE